MRPNRRHATLAAAALLAAAGILSAGLLLRPAYAASNAPAVRPDTLVTCNSSGPCQAYQNTGGGPGLEGLAGKGAGLRGKATGNGIGLFGTSVNGPAVRAVSSNFVGVNVMGGFTNTGGEDFPALSIVGSFAGMTTFGDDLIDACEAGTALSSNVCSSNTSVFSVNTFGDIGALGRVNSSSNGLFRGSLEVGGATSPASGYVNITGQYLKNNSCVAGCALPTQKSGGRAVATYSAQVTTPMIEDFGEAQMVNGRASVRLSADFANVMDSHANYMVFLTPEGDNRGLYVTNKTASFFAVRESQGGRSNLAFSYRVVAKPLGAGNPRLPMVTTQPLHARSR